MRKFISYVACFNKVDMSVTRQ